MDIDNFALGLAVAALIWLALAVNRYGVTAYLSIRRDRPAWRPAWFARLEFTAQALGGFSYLQLILISVLSLFLELLMIRWISSEISVFAYFKNFVLIACFLGFGLGCYLSRRPINLAVMIVPLLALALTCTLPWRPLRTMVDDVPMMLGLLSQVDLWGVPHLPLSLPVLISLVRASFVIVPVFALIALVFVPIGQLVGWLLENASNGILAYTVNILSSLAGIAIFTLVCFLFLPPAIWFLIAGVILVMLLWIVPRLRWAALATFLVCAGLTSLAPTDGGTVFWSPYQKLALTSTRRNGEIVSYEIKTNSSWYQQILNLSSAFANAHPDYFVNAPVEWNPYNLPYRFDPHPRSVLVLGAGSGNDVAAALRNGAGRVVAVEIDPLILKLGRQLHFEKPYSSPRVRVVLNDARSYVENTGDRFDLIVFAALDSHTTSSYYSSIRIDNYIYTLQAFAATKHLLNVDGLMIVKFQVTTPWIATRLRELMQTAFGRAPLELETPRSTYTRGSAGGHFMVAGSHRKIEESLSDPQLAAYVARHRDASVGSAALTTDDWPYFYQHEPGLPGSVIIISAILVLLCCSFLREIGIGASSIRWHFFFLGAGFMLLEAQIISRMALLFGTTWVVNSIVIAGLLILIAAANQLVELRPRMPVAVGYLGISATILVAYAIPLETFFFTSIWIKALCATTVLCLPVFFAGIVFIRSFAREGFRGEALGSNLLGALVGGLLESLSMWTGIHSLLIVAGTFYAASWIALEVQEPMLLSGTSTTPHP